MCRILIDNKLKETAKIYVPTDLGVLSSWLKMNTQNSNFSFSAQCPG